MKAFTSSLQHFIVRNAQISNKEAVHLILPETVLVKGTKGNLSLVLLPEEAVYINDQLIKKPAINLFVLTGRGFQFFFQRVLFFHNIGSYSKGPAVLLLLLFHREIYS